MNPHLALAFRACLSLAAVGLVGGIILLFASFVVTPAVALSYRSLVLTWLGGYLLAVGGAYVLLTNQTVKGASHPASEADVSSGLPRRFRRIGYVVVATAFTAFFASIALVEAGLIDRNVGEAAILGAFSVGAFSGMFGGLWSALRRGSEDAA